MHNNAPLRFRRLSSRIGRGCALGVKCSPVRSPADQTPRGLRRLALAMALRLWLRLSPFPFSFVDLFLSALWTAPISCAWAKNTTKQSTQLSREQTTPQQLNRSTTHRSADLVAAVDFVPNFVELIEITSLGNQQHEINDNRNRNETDLRSSE